MKKTMTPRDWQMLSEYLDNQLSPGDRARLENRLRVEPEMHSALKELRLTRRMLRSLPKMKAPRSFKLTPEMAGQRSAPRMRLFPVFQFASALASLLLVLALVGDFLGIVGAAPGAEQSVELMQASPLAAERGAMPEEPSSRMADDLESPGILEAYEDPLLEEISPTLTAEAYTFMSEPQLEEGLGLQATEPATDGGLLETETQQPGFSLTSWQIVEISLAVFALASGLIAFFLRSRSN